MSTQGFQKNDVMGILLPNCTSYILGLLGAMEAGLTVTTLNPAYTMPEVARQLEMSKAKIILTEESRVAAVKEAMKQIGILPEYLRIIKNVAFLCLPSLDSLGALT